MSFSAQVHPSPTPQDVEAAQDYWSKPAEQRPKTLSSSDPHAESGAGRGLHFRLGAVSIGGGYISDPFYPYGPHPFDNYGPYPYSPFFVPSYSVEGAWVPYAPGGRAPYPLDLSYRSQKGEVKLSADPGTATVYLDGALAGTASHLRHIWLEPGAYDLAVASPGLETFHQRLYVLSGKSLRVEAKLSRPN